MKKILCFLLLFICTLCGCSTNLGAYQYHITVVGEECTIREEWKAANRTYGAYYKEEYDEAKDEWIVYYDKEVPETRTYFIVSEEELNERFTSFPDVDFEKQMVVVHFYTDIYTREQLIDYAKVNGKTLEIRFSLRKNDGRGDAAQPYTRTLILVMDTLSVEEAKIRYN